MKKGKYSMEFQNEPRILATSTIVGKSEGEGPLGNYFDKILDKDKFGEKTFELAERKMIKHVVSDVTRKVGLESSDIDLLIGGDLLNQIVSTSFVARDFETPFLGLYGACSTMAEALTVGAIIIDSQNAEKVVASTGTHFSSVERQFRFPLELGTQRPPSSQWTVTGAGATLLSSTGDYPKIKGATIGRVIDFGVGDANNMGAAMAPAGCDTLYNHFNDFNRDPDYYDIILSGDLGVLGGKILKDLMHDKGMELGDNYFDSGALIYKVDDSKFQGGSGAGCSASVLNGYIYKKMLGGDYNKVLFMATGALLSPTTALQKQTIPGIAHAVVIEN